MCNFRCPYAERRKCAGFLLCGALMREGTDYNVRANALGAICRCQEQCVRTGLMENVDEARACYAKKRAEEEAADAKKRAEIVGSEILETEIVPLDDAPVTADAHAESAQSKKSRKKKAD